MVILVVALIAFGPDRLPDFARQAGRMVRQVRRVANSARDDIRAELGPQDADLPLNDLDPRKANRKNNLGAGDEEDEEEVPAPVESAEQPVPPCAAPPLDH